MDWLLISFQMITMMLTSLVVDAGNVASVCDSDVGKDGTNSVCRLENMGMDTTKEDGRFMILILIQQFGTLVSCLFQILALFYCFKLLIKFIEFKTSPLRRAPGPIMNSDIQFFLGDFITIRKEPFMVPHFQWIHDLAQAQNDPNWKTIPFVRYSWLFGKLSILILDKNIVKEVLTAPYGKPSSEKKLRFGKDVKFLINIVGDGLVTLEGKDWMRHRSIIQPAFFTNHIKESLNVTVPYYTQQLIQHWKNAKEGAEIEVCSHLSSLTLDVIGDVAFSHSFHALEGVKRWSITSHLTQQTNNNHKGQDDNGDNTTTTTTDNNDNGNEKTSSSSSSVINISEVDDPLIQALTRAFQPTWIGTVALILNLPKLGRYFNPRTIRTRKALNAAVDKVIENVKMKIKESNNETNNNNTGETMNTTCEQRRLSSPFSLKKRSLLQLLLEANARDGDDVDTFDDDDKNSSNDNKSVTSSTTSNTHTSNQHKKLNDVELRDEVKTFLFAGHETTSTWCYMVIYALVTYPDIQEKVYQDVMRHVPKPGEEKDKEKNETVSGNATSPFDLETVEQMEYFHAFLQEVLRYYPPVGMVTRVNNYPETFGGHEVPAGARIVISPYVLHRHPAYWDNPDVFSPERWIFSKTKNDKNAQNISHGEEDNNSNNTEEEEEMFWNRIRFAFIPFSAGGRNCIGQRFATVEAKLIMAELIRNFVFEVAPSHIQEGTEFTMSNVVVMKTKPRLKIIVKPRD